jgi:hypothetical protein
MTESIPTTWNDERDDAFFGIAQTLRADADLTAQIETMLQDMIAAESWEIMAVRSAERAKHHERDLVPAPVAFLSPSPFLRPSPARCRSPRLGARASSRRVRPLHQDRLRTTSGIVDRAERIAASAESAVLRHRRSA